MHDKGNSHASENTPQKTPKKSRCEQASTVPQHTLLTHAQPTACAPTTLALHRHRNRRVPQLLVALRYSHRIRPRPARPASRCALNPLSRFRACRWIRRLTAMLRFQSTCLRHMSLAILPFPTDGQNAHLCFGRVPSAPDARQRWGGRSIARARGARESKCRAGGYGVVQDDAGPFGEGRSKSRGRQRRRVSLAEARSFRRWTGSAGRLLCGRKKRKVWRERTSDMRRGGRQADTQAGAGACNGKVGQRGKSVQNMIRGTRVSWLHRESTNYRQYRSANSSKTHDH